MRQLLIITTAVFVFVSCSEKKDTSKKPDTTVTKEKVTSKTDSSLNVFTINHASKNYDFTIVPSDTGKAKSKTKSIILKISRKNEDKPFQEIVSASCNYKINDSTKLPSVNNEKGINAFIVNDFNFDGSEDLAVQNGEPGGLQADYPYDIYIYSSGENNFVLNKEFTKLAENGMFDVDIPNKRLSTFYVSGCCYHENKKYEVKNNVPVWVYSEILNETGKNTEIEYYTKTLVDGKWKKGVIKKKE